MNATPRFLQLADVAEVLNISGAQVYALVRRQELKAIKIGGRGQWRVEASELEAYIQRAYADAEQFVRRAPVRRRVRRTPRTDPRPADAHPRRPCSAATASTRDRLDDAVGALAHVQLEEVAADPADPTLDLLVVAEVHQAVLAGRRQPRAARRAA